MDKKQMTEHAYLKNLIKICEQLTDSIVKKENSLDAVVNLRINKYGKSVTAIFDGRQKEYLVWDSAEHEPLIAEGRATMKKDLRERLMRAYKLYKLDKREEKKRREEKKKLLEEE